MKHTPGPWLVHESLRRDGLHIMLHNPDLEFGKRAIADILQKSPPDGDAMRADAQLIAAAPNLLYACQRAATHLARYGEDNPGDDEVMGILLAAIDLAERGPR